MIVNDDELNAVVHLFPALDGLDDVLRVRLRADLQVRCVPAGSRLFDDGVPCAALPLVLEGCVRVSRLAANGREIRLYRVRPGEACVLSTGCLLGHRDYGATGVAETTLRLALIPRLLFDELVVRHRPFRTAVFALVSERLAELMLLVEEVAFRRLDARLALLLVDRGPDVRMNHQAIAADLGSVREMVSRLLSDFAERGWVELGRERVQILDRAALRRLAQPDSV